METTERVFDVIIVGAGPAGLSCAIQAAAPKSRILLLEKKGGPGTKLLLSGSGQCNITHAGDINNFFARYGRNGKFLKPALLSFTNQDLLRFFGEHGLSMMTGENGKVFPETRSSADVLEILIRLCKERGVAIRTGEPVTGITRTSQDFCVMTTTTSYRSPILVLATGGSSYPQTGSTGDGFGFAKSLGQPVTETGPALTPLLIRNFPFAPLAGMSFDALPFTCWREGKKVADRVGDVLFTHLGLSGPGILDASRDIRSGDIVRLSFVGTMKREEFDDDLTRRVQENGTWQVRTLLAAYPIPERLNRKLLAISEISDDLRCSHLSVRQRAKLIANCTAFPLTVEAPGGYKVAMVTRGGVALETVNPKTMESKLIPGLYFAGEVLDLDGDTGGYNLQAAFSTGVMAGRTIQKARIPDKKSR
jgi:predicted Rossmann fold flavoprotein